MTEPRLRLLSSDRLEVLADDLALRMVEHPLPPLVDETVVVGSRGMARWLNHHLAHAHGIAASIETPFPFTWARRTVDRVLGDDHRPEDDPFGAGRLPWRVHELLGRLDALDLDDTARAPLERYLADDTDGRRRGQLAMRLARQYVNYQVQRPDGLRRWEDGRWFGDEAIERAGEVWQAALWRALVASGRPGEPLSTALDRAMARIVDSSVSLDLPPRITVFGLSSLPPAILALVRALSERIEVTVATVTPTAQYVASAETTRRPRFDEVTIDQAHPLLAAWGKVGIEFHEQLLAAGDHAEIDQHFQDVTPTTILSSLQHDLHEARLPETPRALPEDRSLRIHLCHSERREIEVARDEILRAIEDGDVTDPSDVLVLVPDVERYAPFVRAVFGSERETTAGRISLPVRIADGGFEEEDDFERLAFLLLERAGGRASAKDLLEILDVPVVARRFGLDLIEAATLRDLVRRAGIRFGRDPRSREETFEVPATEGGTWREGLDRLLLGYALGVESEPVDGLVAAGDTTTGRSAVVGALVRAVETLLDRLEGLESPRALDDWCAALTDGLIDLTKVDGDPDATAARAEFLTHLDALAGVAVDDPHVARPTLAAALRARLTDDGAGRGFVSGSVTVAELRPMRSLPYPMIVVAGLDSDSFPRPDPAAGLDLVATAPRRGDRSVRLDDRQMLLEVVASARRRLVLSAVGFEPRDNSERAVSVCVDELGEALDRSFAGDDAYVRVTVRHRLQPFHACYGDDEHPEHFTYDKAVIDGALALRREARLPEPFVDGPLETARMPRDAAGRAVIDLDDLARFWSNPSRWFVKEVLGIGRRYDEEDLEGHGLEPDALTKYRARQRLVEVGGADVDPSALALDADRQHAWISGASARLGLRAKLEETLAVWGKLLPSGPREALEVRLAGDEWTLDGRLTVDVAAGQVIAVANASARTHVLVDALVRHVVYGCVLAASDPDRVAVTRVVPAEKTAYGWHLIGDVNALLDALIEGFVEGQRRPLPWFADTSAAWFQAFEALRSSDPEGDVDPDDPSVRRHCWERARGKWLDDAGTGEGADEAVRICTRGYEDPVRDDFVHWACLLGPLLSGKKQGGLRRTMSELDKELAR